MYHWAINNYSVAKGGKHMRPEHRARCEGGIMESGVSATKAGRLFDAGYTKAALLRAASDEELLAVPGIGRTALGKIRAWAGP